MLDQIAAQAEKQEAALDAAPAASAEPVKPADSGDGAAEPATQKGSIEQAPMSEVDTGSAPEPGNEGAEKKASANAPGPSDSDREQEAEPPGAGDDEAKQPSANPGKP